MSNGVDDNLHYIKLLSWENGMNEPSNQVMDLSAIGREVEWICKESNKNPSWLGEVGQRNIWGKLTRIIV